MTKRVGYGSPPNHTKWPKGRSGNPSGRKKGVCNLETDLVEELGEVIHVTEAGKPRKLTKQRAFIKSVVTRGITGDARSASLLVTLITQLIGGSVDAVPDAPLSAEDEALIDDFLARRKPPEGKK